MAASRRGPHVWIIQGDDPATCVKKGFEQMDSEEGDLVMEVNVVGTGSLQSEKKQVLRTAEALQAHFKKNVKIHLWAEDNELTSLPEAIARIPNLEELIFWGNKLKSIPDCFAQLHKLQSLSLKSSSLTSFPLILCQLPQLQILDLEGCKLKDLPPEFAKLQTVTNLSLRHNLFELIPRSVGRLTRLEALQIDGMY